MSELIQKHDNRAIIRGKLLTGASALALVGYISATSLAVAEEADQSPIWIELGGQLSRLNDSAEFFSPTFPNSVLRPSIFSPSQKFEYPPKFSIDETGKLSFQPEGSDWVVAASIQYGRSSINKNVFQGTNPGPLIAHYTLSGVPKLESAFPHASQFAGTTARNSEYHLVLDFQAGKDVGLGMFARHGSSVLNLGVRFAQFSSNSNIIQNSDPDWHFHNKYFPNGAVLAQDVYHTNHANMQAERSFHGIGPSLAWDGSAPLAGNSQAGEVAVDWGVNAALLFGRQRAQVHHQQSAQYHKTKYRTGYREMVSNPTPVHLTRSKSVMVPNIGGSLGASYRIENFKVSFGYRADLFLHAMDGGVDMAKKENVGFYGPFASVSVGLGG